MQGALDTSTVGKLPGRKILYASLLASVIFCALSWCAALDVIDVLEGVSEEFFLIGAVWAPPCAIHFRAAFIYTFGEAIQYADGLAIVGKVINCPCNDCKGDGDPKPN